MDHSLKGYFTYFVSRLQSIYEPGEAEAIAGIVFEELLFMKKHHIHILSRTFTQEEIDLFNRILERLLTHEPVQYVLGVADFSGLKLKVNKSVLIPRRETEELVDIVIRHVKQLPEQDCVILDACTGSGCIAIAMKKGLPAAHLLATDLSAEALRIAEENAERCRTPVHFFAGNVLDQDFAPGRIIDILVGNPPYITRAEETELPENVKLFEPHEALFVTNDDPLQFYKALARIGINHFGSPGWVFAEIHESHGKEVQKLFTELGFEAEILPDMQGKDRFLKAVYHKKTVK